MTNAAVVVNASVSHPARGAWIEMTGGGLTAEQRETSHPARGAWIEIFEARECYMDTLVAPRKGCVD